jgi:hypothetical protein
MKFSCRLVIPQTAAQVRQHFRRHIWCQQANASGGETWSARDFSPFYVAPAGHQKPHFVQILFELQLSTTQTPLPADHITL